MNPDGIGCNVQFVNATGEALMRGQPPAGFQPFGSYQMAAWFDNLSTLAPPGGIGGGFAQALRGADDQDDSANLPVSLGNATDPNYSVFQYFASSASNSAHFMYLIGTLGSSITGKVVLGVAPAATFESTPPAQVQWYQLNTTVDLGFPPTLSLIVVDLDLIYDSATAAVLYNEIGAKSLSANELTDLYAQVIGYCYPDLTTLDYELTEVNFTNAPTPITSGKTLLGSSNYSIPPGASVTEHISISGLISQTFTLSSSTMWGAGVEVSFSIPLPVDLETTISGTFEYQNGEEAQTTGEVTVEVADDVELAPGNWNVSAYVNLANNYTANFTATLQVTGTIAAPAAGLGAQPLNGTVLTSIMGNSDRNNGSQVSPFTPGPNITTASVSGTLSGDFAFGSSVVATPLAATQVA